MTSQQFLVCDSSTLANFKQWAQAISAFFATAGWIQTSDTGQVNWSSISAVPGSGLFVYEIWKPGDALTVFYVRIEYGNVSGTNCPSIKLSIGTNTNGAGTLTGFFTSVINTNPSSFTPPSTTTQFECDFSGTNNRIGVMMWRNGTNSCQQFFAIERSLNASGVYTGAYVTLFTGGQHGTFANYFAQQSLVFAIGAAPISSGQVSSSGQIGGLLVRGFDTGGLMGSTAFGGAIAIDMAAPCVGYFDYPCTVAGAGFGADLAEGVTFQSTLYGSTVTFMPSKNGPFSRCGPMNSPGGILVMRYD